MTAVDHRAPEVTDETPLGVSPPHPEGVEYGTSEWKTAATDDDGRVQIDDSGTADLTTKADKIVDNDGNEIKGNEAKEPKEDVLEIILPSAEPRAQKIFTTDGEVAGEYVQKPLSYFRKMQFFKLLAKGLKEAIDEGGADGIAEIFGGGTVDARNLQSLSQTDFNDAGSFLRFVMSIIEQSEDLLEDAYVIWLAVPPGQRVWAKAAMRGDIEGVEPLSDEDGWAIVNTFVVQNWGAMRAFFTVHAREVMEVAKAEQNRLNKLDQ